MSSKIDNIQDWQVYKKCILYIIVKNENYYNSFGGQFEIIHPNLTKNIFCPQDSIFEVPRWAHS